MTQLWNVQKSSLEIFEMPFYWRLSNTPNPISGIPSRLGIRVTFDEEYDYLKYLPTATEWHAINTAYRQNANIGFLNPESGQMHTYGSSVNKFFLDVINTYAPSNIYEIGCGAGFSIQFMKENGWPVTGIDPSEYSLEWSNQLGFSLENTFFDSAVITNKADLIYCNDVFEHIPQVESFSHDVYTSLKNGGVFCFSTTNSSRSIKLGDISMLEHQHVNMFTERSIYEILYAAGFSEIKIISGSYGNTFHVIAVKHSDVKTAMIDMPQASCAGFFERAQRKIEAFGKAYKCVLHSCQYYVPLRCIPYLATVGDYGESELFDSNASWQGKYIDGYTQPIRSITDIKKEPGSSFFIGSLTFYEEIKQTLLKRGFQEQDIYSIVDINSRVNHL